MKYLFINIVAFAFATVSTVSVAAAQQERAPVNAAEARVAKLKLAREVVDVSFPIDQWREMNESVIKNLTQQFLAAERERKPTVTEALSDPRVKSIFDLFMEDARIEILASAEANRESLMSAYAAAYARTFSEPELGELLVFMATATGRKYMRESGKLLADPDIAEANRRYISDMMPRIEKLKERMMGELERELENRELDIKNDEIG